MTRKKVLTILLSALMMFSLGACGGSGVPGGETPTIQPDFSLDDKLTVDWMIPTQDTLSVDETPMIKYLANKFNVSFDVSQSPPSAHDTNFELLLSSKDQHTVTSRITHTLANEYGSYGVFLDFAPYLDYMPNFKALVKSATEEDANNRSLLYDLEGHMYRIPSYLANAYPIYNFSFNKEAFTEVGFADPKTWDDVYTALKALKAKYPDSTPFSLRATEEGMGLALNNFIISYTGGYANGQQFYGFDPESDQFKLSLETDGYKDAVKMFNKLYNEGLVDKAYDSQDGEALMAKIGKKKVFMTCDFQGGFSGFKGNEENTSVLAPLFLPARNAETTATYGYRVARFDDKAGTVIDNKVAKDPLMLGRLLKMIDYMYSEEFINLQWFHPDVTEGSFPSGETDPAKYVYTLTEGQKTYKPSVYNKATQGDITNTYFNWSVYAHFYNLNDPVVDPQTHAEFYKFRKAQIENKDKYVDVPLPIFNNREAKKVAANNATVKITFEMNIAKIAEGNFTDAAWSRLIGLLKDEGGNSLVDTFNTAYQRSKPIK